eukprot:407411_1
MAHSAQSTRLFKEMSTLQQLCRVNHEVEKAIQLSLEFKQQSHTEPFESQLKQQIKELVGNVIAIISHDLSNTQNLNLLIKACSIEHRVVNEKCLEAISRFACNPNTTETQIKSIIHEGILKFIVQSLQNQDDEHIFITQRTLNCLFFLTTPQQVKTHP